MCETRQLNHEELNSAVEVQRAVWGYSDLDLAPQQVFLLARHTGGQALGAYRDGRMVGYLLALAGLKPDGRPYLHSHQLAVLPEFRRQGVGKLLKCRQRQEARDRGIELVEWTFDPLEINNAWLNINRLGAVVRQFRPNFYGKTSSRLHGALHTDRCIAEWWVASDRVERVLAGQIPRPRVEAAVAVPSRAVGVGAADSAAASRIQQRVREEFLLLLGRGLTVTGFQRTEQGGVYLFSRFEKAPAASAAAREVLAPCS